MAMNERGDFMRIIVHQCPVCNGERFRIIEANGTPDIDVTDLIFECLECGNEWDVRETHTREATFSEKITVATRKNRE
jgi:uncharacterized Zn finger protein